MNSIRQIIDDIKTLNTRPIYFLMGEEAYYIDKISDYIEENLLKEEEKGFNQVVLYGRDVTVEDIISQAKRYPMMAERQVVIVKEAQELSRTIEKLLPYAENPQPTTVLVICYKYKSIDRRKKLCKVVGEKGVLFESKKLYENQVGEWITANLRDRGYDIEPKATQMLVEFLGTDLSKIDNELEKLALILPKGTRISARQVEENIGISKDYNNFELRKAIGEKQFVRANQIINYFAENPRTNPLVVTISLLHNFFAQLLLYHGLKDKGRINVAKMLRINPYFVSEYQKAASNYPMRKVAQVISHLREADMKSKGVGASNMAHGDILKQLLFKIMH